MKTFCSALILCAVALFAVTHSVQPEENVYTDGVFEGTHAFVTVRVAVEQGKITDIVLLHHGGGGDKYAQMIQPLLSRIVENQTTDVDGVTGATVSSDYLKRAVENALKQKK